MNAVPPINTSLSPSFADGDDGGAGDLAGRQTDEPRNAISPIADLRDEIFGIAAETSVMPMVVADASKGDHPIVFTNNAFLAMTGYARDEIIGSNCRFLQGPETDPETVAAIRTGLAERREVATEILNYRKDGSSLWIALNIKPVFDQAGRLVYFLAWQLDVSRRRAAEEALRQTQKMQVMGRLTGSIAHDFNNLLQVMVGYLELIGSGLQKPEINREKLLRGIGNARAAADRATSLTKQLLTFARKQRLEGTVSNLNDLIRTLNDLLSRILSDEVVLTTILADDLRNCRIDATQVEIALLNIIVTARDAMRGRADRRVAIETSNVLVSHENLTRYPSMAPGRYASISIGDTGAGLPAPIVERLMDPFFVAKEEGSGIGLSMVYGFAKQSGGCALIHSEADVGTTICLYFPAVDEPVAPRAMSGSRAVDRAGSETILVVEPRADVAEFVRIILDSYGYTVLHRSNGHDALDVIESAAPLDMLFSELITSDGLDGVSLARAAKRHRKDIKVLLTTGYTEASSQRSDFSGSEFEVLDKPYGRTDLARKIRFILDASTA